MKLSKPSWYLDEKVMPVVRDYLCDLKSESRARVAMVDLHQFAERVFEYCRESKPEYLPTIAKSDFLGGVRKAHPDVGLLARIGNTLKHHKIIHNKVVFTATGQTQVKDDAVWVCDEHCQPIRRVDDLLNSVIGFWRHWLSKHPDT